MPTPSNAFPTISENLTVRFKLATLLALIAAIVGGAVWMTNMRNLVDSMDRRLERIEDAIDAIGLKPRSSIDHPKQSNP